MMAADDLTRRSVMQLTGAALVLPNFLENSRMSFTPRFVDLVRNSVTTVGTGNFVLGPPVTGFNSFATAVQPGESFYYSCAGVSKPAECEVGRGTMQDDGTISREPINGVLTDFTPGPKTISLIAAAEWFARVDQAAAPSPVDVADRVALASAGLERGAARFLVERGREGMFRFEPGNLSAKVAADPGQAIYVAPKSDPSGTSGAWVRKFDGPVSPSWFGLVEGDANGANGAANSAAWNAMRACMTARAVNVLNTMQATEAVRFPAGYFEFASTIEITDGATILEGAASPGTNAGGAATTLAFPAGVTGIRVQRYNTSGASAKDAVEHYGGNGSAIRNLALHGGYTPAVGEGEAHGIHLRGKALIESVFIKQFQGDGIYGVATAGGEPEGNANNSAIANCRVQECRNGIFIDGADANIWTLTNVDCSSNRAWGFYDSSFLGNTYLGCHGASNGFVVGGSAPTIVSHLGKRYSCVMGQEAGASTNAPSGDTTDNAWWYYVGAGAASSSIPAWASGTVYRSGGSYASDNVNAQNWYGGCYHEGGQGRPQLSRPSLVLGGMLADAVRGSAGTLQVNSEGDLQTNAGFSAVVGKKFACLGGDSSGDTIVAFKDTGAVDSGVYRLKRSGADFRWDYGNGGTTVAFWVTGNSSTVNWADGAPRANALIGTRFGLPSSFGGSVGTVKPVFRAAVSSATYAAPAGGATVDAEGRASLAQLAADLADMKAKLQAAGLMS